jgi:hypothetical protein
MAGWGDFSFLNFPHAEYFDTGGRSPVSTVFVFCLHGGDREPDHSGQARGSGWVWRTPGAGVIRPYMAVKETGRHRLNHLPQVNRLNFENKHIIRTELLN